MGADEDLVERVICGKWKFDSDDNSEECMRAMGYPKDAIDFMMATQPKMNVTRDGDAFNMEFEMVPGKLMKYKFKIGEEVDVIDDHNDPPTYHNKEHISVEGGIVKLITKSQLDGPAKIDTETHFVNVGDRLYNLMSKLGDRSVIGNRIFVRDN